MELRKKIVSRQNDLFSNQIFDNGSDLIFISKTKKGENTPIFYDKDQNRKAPTKCNYYKKYLKLNHCYNFALMCIIFMVQIFISSGLETSKIHQKLLRGKK